MKRERERERVEERERVDACGKGERVGEQIESGWGRDRQKQQEKEE